MKAIINNVLVEFDNGTKHLYRTSKTIPEIQQKFALNKRFITDVNSIVVVDAVTIG